MPDQTHNLEMFYVSHSDLFYRWHHHHHLKWIFFRYPIGKSCCFLSCISWQVSTLNVYKLTVYTCPWYNSKHRKILKILVKTHRNVLKASNQGYTTSLLYADVYRKSMWLSLYLLPMLGWQGIVVKWYRRHLSWYSHWMQIMVSFTRLCSAFVCTLVSQNVHWTKKG